MICSPIDVIRVAKPEQVPAARSIVAPLELDFAYKLRANNHVTVPSCLTARNAQTLFLMINTHNSEVRRERKDKEEQAKKMKTLALAVIVDDLDRCSEEKIMEMLKATHLLLEQPKAPMAVFLAVDPQLIVSAITESLEGVQNTVMHSDT